VVRTNLSFLTAFERNDDPPKPGAVSSLLHQRRLTLNHACSLLLKVMDMMSRSRLAGLPRWRWIVLILLAAPVLFSAERAGRATEEKGTRAAKEDTEPSIVVLPMHDMDPDEKLEEILKLITGGRCKFVMDRRRRLMVMSGNSKDIRYVKEFLDRPARRNKVELPAELKEVTAELGELGLTRPQLVTQLAISTTANTPFETSGTVKYVADHHLSVSGIVVVKRRTWDLQLTLSVAQTASRRAPRRIATFRTQAMVDLLGRPQVIGVIPADTLTSAFVIQVINKRLPRQVTKTTVPELLPPPTEEARSRKYTFEFRAKPWSEVFKWLSDQTNLPVIAPYKLAGTFTFVPSRAGRRYTVPEIIDILNESLVRQEFELIHRKRNLTLVPIEEIPDKVMRVRPEELKWCGQTIFVCLVIQLRTLQAHKVAPEVKKMLGRYGDVAALAKSNQLLVQDRAGNVRRIWQMLDHLETSQGK
jgi:type II secretory pathway component GspD/PulD (secretin)